MEDESVAQVELTPEVVKHRVQQLNALFDQIEGEFLPKVAAARAAQTTSTWSSSLPAAQFRSTMAAQLTTAKTRLEALWAEVQHLCTTLEQNAADLTELDQATRDDLTTLLTRADGGPAEPLQAPVPVPVAPDTDVAGPASPFALPQAAPPTSSSDPFAALAGGGGSWDPEA